MSAKYIRCFASCSVVFLLFLSTARAQTVTGSITGRITDPSGAVIAGASVTAENTATSVKTVAKSNAAGVYSIRFLPIGSYIVTIEASGFSLQKIPPFSLEIGQTAQ